MTTVTTASTRAQLEHLEPQEIEGRAKGLQRDAPPLRVSVDEEAGHGHRTGRSAQELERDVGHETGAVAGAPIGGARPAMFHPRQGA